ncbi:hypothetical protein P3I01_003155 [Escherichia coli]|nr:hypothetical protein [Escherichia coli]
MWGLILERKIIFNNGFLSINREVIIIFLIYFILVGLGISGVIYSRYVDEGVKYLLVTPSFLNNSPLNWTTSVWAGVLGIHGTIAALSITFMGMFVSQVSNYSEHGFENICKSMLLRKTSFLKFSLNSIFSLLSGIVLLSCGGGMITYAISIFVSLYFIFNYGSMYLKLYNVTENPTIITDRLFFELDKAKNDCLLIDERRRTIENKFLNMINDFEYIHYGWDSDFINKGQRKLNIFQNNQNVIINDFCPICFKEINNELERFSKVVRTDLRVNLNFIYPLSTSSVHIEVQDGASIDELLISNVTKLLKKGLVFSSAPESFLNYGKYEDAVVISLRNSLFSGNELALDFSIRAIFTLVSETELVKVIHNLNHSFGYTNKKNNIEYSIFAAFYMKVSSEVSGYKNYNIVCDALRSIMDLGRYIYDNEQYDEFYKLISPSLEHRAQYSLGDPEYRFFDLYMSTVRDNILSKNYLAFSLNTRFLTEKFRYPESSDDGETLSIIENKMVSCVRQVITLLIIRLCYLSEKSDGHQEELRIIKQNLMKWLAPSFLEDLFYKSGVYDVIFTVPSEPDFDASRTLRDIPDYEVATFSINNDAFKAVSLLMTQTLFNKNNLNPIFIRNKKEFIKNTKITTHELQSLISYLKGDEFSALLELINEGSSQETNRMEVAEHLESIISVKNELIANSIVSSDLDKVLVNKYIDKVSISLGGYFNKFVDIDSIPVSNSVVCNPFYSLINKREVLQSIDKVHYSMNSSHHAEVFVYAWLHKMLDGIKGQYKDVNEIEDVSELPSDKLITIHYMVKGEASVYRYSKGMRITDSKGVLGLGSPGLYYMDFLSVFSCLRNTNLFDLKIESISDENISLVKGLYNFKDENPLMYALMSIRINLEFINNDGLSFYYISVDSCKKITALHEQKLRLSFNDKKPMDDIGELSD